MSARSAKVAGNRLALWALGLSVATMPLETTGWLSGMSQVSISKLALVVAVGAMLVDGASRRTRFSAPPGWSLLLAFWVVCLVVSSVRWLGTTLDLPNNLIAVTGYVAFVFVVYWVVRTDADLDAIIGAIIVGSLPVIVVGVAEFITKQPVVPNHAEYLYAGGDDLFRITATFYDANALGRYLVFASLATVAALSRPGFRVWRGPLVAVFAGQAFCLANSFSRGSVIAVAAGIVTYAVWRLARREPVGVSAAVVAVALIASWLLVPGLPQAFRDRVFEGPSHEVAMGTRPEIARDALIAVADSPLLGYGPDHDADAIGRYYGSPVSAHNLYLETALVAGIPGALLLALYLGRHVVRLLRARGTDDVVRARLVLLPLLGLLVGGLTLHGIKEAEMWVVIALLAPIVGLTSPDHREPGRSPALS